MIQVGETKNVYGGHPNEAILNPLFLSQSLVSYLDFICPSYWRTGLITLRARTSPTALLPLLK